MRILVTNDDGIFASGLWLAAEVLKDYGEVTVVAPDRDLSGIGAAFTVRDVLRVNETRPQVEGVRAFAVQGTPGDCVILAADQLVGAPIDLLVSGINRGANLGLDVVTSGTVGAAMHGWFRGIASVAISLASLTDVDYEATSRTLRVIVSQFQRGRLQPCLLNVNLPSLPASKVEGVDETCLGPRGYGDSVERVETPRGDHYWIRHNVPTTDEVKEGTDVWSVRNRRVSVTNVDLLAAGSAHSQDLSVMLDEIREGLHTND